jgi:hypothetical protein
LETAEHNEATEPNEPFDHWMPLRLPAERILDRLNPSKKTDASREIELDNCEAIVVIIVLRFHALLMLSRHGRMR